MAKRASYHHGDLRRVLLDASLALVNEAGVGALSLREVARKAGVSHNAPYHHFPDKGSVLSAIALEGLGFLCEAMVAGTTAAGGDPLARLEACGLAYIRFALSHPAHFRVMFRPELCTEDDPIIREAGAKPFEQVVVAVMACQEAGLIPAGDPTPVVLTCWSAVHGLASLWLDGPLTQNQQGLNLAPERLAEMVVFTLSRALATGRQAARKKRKDARPSKDAQPSKALAKTRPRIRPAG